MARYYLDTCVWRDFYENRVGPGGRPLGEHAAKLIMKLIESTDEIMISDLVITELKGAYSQSQIDEMLEIFFRLGMLSMLSATPEQGSEAYAVGKARNLPKSDVLHAILARDSQAILISQDNHFAKLSDIIFAKRPEQLL